MNSLRAKLMFWLLGAVAVIGTGGAWVSYRHALAEADAYFDYHLRETAMLLRDQAYGFAANPGLPDTVPAYDFIVQVWTLDGLRIYQSRPHTVVPGLTQLGLSTVETSNGRWRVYGVEARDRVIQIAQPMGVRERRAAQLALRTLQPFAFLLPALALLIVWIVGRLTRPVRDFSDALLGRSPEALEPVTDTGLPGEILPVVVSLNDLLGRLRESLARERSFIADAAHELRTPLTALRLQAEEVGAAGSAAERADAALHLREGIERATRLVEQMLALAREERGGLHERAPVDLGVLVGEVIEELLPLADARRIDLGVTGVDTAVIPGERESLRVLVRNLVDNALRYTPAGGRVDVGIQRAEALHSQAGYVLTVTDTGPGIPPLDRERVFDRFYRLPGSEASGSGIGLALVRSIARHHQAEVTLGDGPGKRGLQVRVTFAA